LLAGCTTYHERFTFFNKDGSTNHVVDVGHSTCLIYGQAARLKTETQTMEFIRTINAEGVLVKPDAESVKAITEGVTTAVIESLKKSAGVPR
jgi:hypothetical protein